MHSKPTQPVSGSLYIDRRRGNTTWYWRIRLPDGRRENRAIGPAWKQRSRPPEGHLTEAMAQAQLQARLGEIRRGAGLLPPEVAGVTFADAAEAWYSHGVHVGFARGPWKPKTRRDNRSVLDAWIIPELGQVPLQDVDERLLRGWREEAMTREVHPLPRRQGEKVSSRMFAILEHAYTKYEITRANPMSRLPRITSPYNPDDYDFYSPEEVLALVRACDEPYVPPLLPSCACGECTGSPLSPNLSGVCECGCGKPTRVAAHTDRHNGWVGHEHVRMIRGHKPPEEPNEQDGTIFMAGAYLGGRLGELLALNVRDVDFEAMVVRFMRQADDVEGDGTTNGGRGRSVPMVPALEQRLARHLQRDHLTGPFDPLFVGERGGEVDRSALRRRYRRAQARADLRPIRLHDLRHTFGSLAARELSDNDLQALLGHRDKRTTQRYTHYRARPEISKKLSKAFSTESAPLEPIDAEALAEIPDEVLMKALQQRLATRADD